MLTRPRPSSTPDTQLKTKDSVRQKRLNPIWIATLCTIFYSASVNDLDAQELTRAPYLQLGTPTGVVVRWQTNAPEQSIVWYGASQDDLSESVLDTSLTTEHEIAVTGLLPETRYYYAVGTGSGKLAGGDGQHYFTTAPLPGTNKPVRLWILGDSGTATRNAIAVRDAYLTYSGNTETDLWLMLGDNAYNDGTEAEYQERLFDIYTETLRKSVLWPAQGNHDRAPVDENGYWTGGTYYDLFTLPTLGEAGGIPSQTEAYYSFDYANIHFICLHSWLDEIRADTSRMWTWLESDLAANEQLWTIAYWHHPPYSKGSHDSDTEGDLAEMRERALPILDRYGVDVVLAGHSHSYERSFMITGHYGVSGTFRDSMVVDDGDGRIDGDGAYVKPSADPTPGAGTVYAVVGSSGKLSSDTGLDHPIMVASQAIHGSLVLDVSGNQLDARFLDLEGNIGDHFTMIKGLGAFGAPHELIMISGNAQVGEINTELPEPLVAEVRDAGGRPVPGLPVALEVLQDGNRTYGPAEAMTDTSGRVSFVVPLPNRPGEIEILLTAARLEHAPGRFTATAVLPPHARLITRSSLHDFGQLTVGETRVDSVWISNKGGVQLVVNRIHIAGADTADFSLVDTSLPPAISFDDSVFIPLRFSPGSEGSKQASLHLFTNDSLANPFEIALSGTANASNPETIVAPVVSTTETPDDADDPAIWIHPTDPTKSLIIGNDKTAGIFVWTLGGELIQQLPQGTNVNNVDVRQNVTFGTDTVDIVAANLRDTGKLAVFLVRLDSLDSAPLFQIADRNSAANDIQEDSYGFALYRDPNDGLLYVFERPKRSAQIIQYRIDDDGTGQGVVVTAVRNLEYDGGVAEGFVADDQLGFFYATEENLGIHKYYADPNADPGPIALFATEDGIVNNREGAALYECQDGTGYLVLSSQGNSTIKIYEREGDNRFIKTIVALDESGNADLGTDGLDVTSAIGLPNFPGGFLVVHDQRGSTFHLYDWMTIAGEELQICPDGVVEAPLPQIAMTETSLQFDEVFIDSSATATLQIYNVGEGDLEITDFLISGDASAEYSTTASPGFQIAPGDSAEIAIQFKPALEGERISLLSIVSNDPNQAQIDIQLQGTGKRQVPVSVDTGSEVAIPEEFALKQNYPNPFNAGTVIEYHLPQQAHAKLTIHNLLGHVVGVLVDEDQMPGVKKVTWDGKDVAGKAVGSGIYYMKLEVAKQSLVRKITLLK